MYPSHPWPHAACARILPTGKRDAGLACAGNGTRGAPVATREFATRFAQPGEEDPRIVFYLPRLISPRQGACTAPQRS